MDNDIVYSSCKDIDTLLCIENKVKALEIKITTYIDIYNVKYTKLYDNIKDDSNTDTDTGGADTSVQCIGTIYYL